MKLIQRFPTEAVGSRVLALAEEEGILAHQEGNCIHFATPKTMSDLSRVVSFLNRAHTKQLLMD